MFSRSEWFKIVGWIISLGGSLAGAWLSLYLYHKTQERDKKIEERLEREIIARKDLEREIIIKSYRNSREESNKERKKLTATILRLRNQLKNVGKVEWIYHDIDDDEKRKEAISAIKGHWDNNSENGKINGLTITELLGENWESAFDSKTGHNIAKEIERLAKMINKENPEKEENNNWLSSIWILIFGAAVAKIGYDYYSRQNNENDKSKEKTK